MKLYVDSREPLGLIELLKARIDNIEFGNLDIGDFIIKDDNNNVRMIFERKTIADLMASIKDGRYREQSFRLSQFALNNHHIFYVIEGNLLDYTLKNNETMRKTLYSAMFSLSYKKGFSLLHANGWLDTAEYVIRFMDKLRGDPLNPQATLEEGMEDGVEGVKSQTYGLSPSSIGVEGVSPSVSPSQKYTCSIKCTKKSNITKDNIGEIMLAQIPGVSMNSAQSLMEKYKTIKNLIDTLEKDEKCLDDFQIEYKNGTRKLNKSTIKSLKEYL